MTTDAPTNVSTTTTFSANIATTSAPSQGSVQQLEKTQFWINSIVMSYLSNQFFIFLSVATTWTSSTLTASRQCNGVPSTDWSCCSSSNQCNVGEGDCDTDSDCVGGLVCGTDNCLTHFSSSSSNWESSVDCCVGQLILP